MIRTVPRKFLSGLALGAALLAGVAEARSQSRIDTELRSLRALPPGFVSWCEAGSLIFKSPSSARFRVSNAALCAGKPDGYVVCGPDGESGANGAPACRNVSAPGA